MIHQNAFNLYQNPFISCSSNNKTSTGLQIQVYFLYITFDNQTIIWFTCFVYIQWPREPYSTGLSGLFKELTAACKSQNMHEPLVHHCIEWLLDPTWQGVRSCQEIDSPNTSLALVYVSIIYNEVRLNIFGKFWRLADKV